MILKVELADRSLGSWAYYDVGDDVTTARATVPIDAPGRAIITGFDAEGEDDQAPEFPWSYDVLHFNVDPEPERGDAIGRTLVAARWVARTDDGYQSHVLVSSGVVFLMDDGKTIDRL